MNKIFSDVLNVNRLPRLSMFLNQDDVTRHQLHGEEIMDLENEVPNESSVIRSSFGQTPLFFIIFIRAGIRTCSIHWYS